MELPKTYNAYVFTETHGDLQHTTVNWEEPASNEVVVKVLACGVCAGYIYTTNIAAKENLAKEARTFEEMVLEEYRRHSKVFSEEESHHLPEHKSWDHTINLKEGAAEELKAKVYSISPNE